MLDAHMIDAVIGLPLNIFYGAGVPACLLILKKKRPADRRDKVLFVYAARHYRELSNKNKLRPQDIMRILVHYHAYGDAAKATKLVKQHSTRLQGVVTTQEAEDVARLMVEYEEFEEAVTNSKIDLAGVEAEIGKAKNKTEREKGERAKAKIEKALEKPRKKLAERDEQIAEVRKLAEEDRHAIETVGQELVALYADPVELGKHARVVEMAEIEENECNLNIPRFVDTFEPEEKIDVNAVLRELDEAEAARQEAEGELRKLLKEVGYGIK
jgi:type I restriction enzyme M protein